VLLLVLVCHEQRHQSFGELSSSKSDKAMMSSVRNLVRNRFKRQTNVLAAGVPEAFKNSCDRRTWSVRKSTEPVAMQYGNFESGPRMLSEIVENAVVACLNARTGELDERTVC
jgi:hypothetical protein